MGRKKKEKMLRTSIVPASFPIDYWQRGMSVEATGATAAVYSCVAAYGQTIASMWINHILEDEDGAKSPLRRSAPAVVLRKPNAYQTRSDFILNLVSFLLYEGNAYALAIRDERGAISELHIMDSKTVDIRVSEDGSVFYSFAQLSNLLGLVEETEKIYVPSRNVLHLRMFTPRNPMVGVTPISYAVSSIATNSRITAQQAAFFQNMSRPSGILTTEQKLTIDQVEAIRQKWEELSTQMNSGRTPILSNGLTWQSMSMSSQDSQIVAAFNMTVLDIARAFRIPPAMVNSMEGSTFNNTEQLMNFWLMSGLGFLIEHIELNFDQLFQLGPNEFIEFDTNSLMRMNFGEKMRAYGDGVTKGLYSPNEARAQLGLPPVPGGEMPRVQQQMVGLDEKPEKTEEPPAEDPPADDPLVDEAEDPTESKVFYLNTIKGALHA